MEIRGVIFDMDGVIFDSESLWKEGYIMGNAKFGVNLSEEFRQSICGKSEVMIRDEIKEIYPSLDVDAYRDYVIDFVGDKVERGEFEVKPYFVETIEYLRARGYRTALATSSYRGRAEMMFRVKGMDMTSLFDSASFLEDVGARSKPDPYIFKITADKMGVDYDKCMVLEDSINGIHAAYNGGMVAVHVRDLIAPDDFCREHCYRLMSSLSEVMDIL